MVLRAIGLKKMGYKAPAAQRKTRLVRMTVPGPCKRTEAKDDDGEMMMMMMMMMIMVVVVVVVMTTTTTMHIQMPQNAPVIADNITATFLSAFDCGGGRGLCA
jgi:hypothetical protein